MSLAQDIRSIYYARGNDELERLLAKVDEFENRHPVPVLQPAMPLRHYREDLPGTRDGWVCLVCGSRTHGQHTAGCANTGKA